MNPGTMVAVHAASAAALARSRCLDAFRVNGATAPDRARALETLGIARDDGGLAYYVKEGVVRGVDHRGRDVIIGDDMHRATAWYLDEAAYVSLRDRRASPRKQAVLVALAVLLAALGALLLVTLGRND